MGKTPKEKVNERRRPYNYLRNTQAQGQFSANETRNYYYSSGSVQRPVAYHRLRGAAPNQFNRGQFRGELYRGRVGNIPKLGKPQLRRHLPSKKIVSPLRRTARRNMQCDLEEQQCEKKESTAEVIQQEEEEEEQPLQSKEEGYNLKNGPSENSNANEDEEKMENGLAAEANSSEEALEQDSGNVDNTNPATKAKSASKDKKAKKNETASKPKGKCSPKSTKDKKLESIEVKKSEKTEIEITEIEVQTKDKKTTKKLRKETESHHTQPTVKVMRLNPQMLAVNAEMNDSSIVEVPVDVEEKQDALPSTSSDWPAPSRASPRRSIRLHEQKTVQDDSIIVVQKNDQDDSVLVLEKESVSITEVSRSSKTNISFGEALSSMRGRRSLRLLPPLNLASCPHTFASRVPSATSIPDPVGQELKTRSFSSIFHKSSTSVMKTTNDLATDNALDDAANSSSTEESGTEADATSSELSSSAADVNMSGKRKISNIQSLDEMQHEHKRFRSINEEQNSTGFLSMISSPMNAFASRIKSGKSSTPVNLVKVSPLAKEDATDLTEDVSEILKEEKDEDVEIYIEKSEKENMEVAVESQSTQSEAPQKKWCNIM